MRGGGAGSYPGGTGVGGAAGASYPQGNPYPYWNPNNKIMSPGYGGSYGYGSRGYGGYGGYGQGGSPFAHSVQNMGYNPSVQSKGFGRQAVLAAGAGAVAGMALGYGLGSFPRPHFHFHSPQEEYYYNHYMYRRYGSSYSGRPQEGGGGAGGAGQAGTGGEGQGGPGGNPPPVLLKPPPQGYDTFMDSCMKRNDLLRSKRSLRVRRAEEAQEVALAQQASEMSTAAPANSEPSGNVTTGAAPQSQNSTDGSPVTPSSNVTVVKEDNRQEAAAETPAEEEKKVEAEEEVVSIMEIGYPALIEQLKARKCIELYMVYTERIAQQQQEELQKQVGERGNDDYRGQARGGGEKLGAHNQGTMLLLSSTVSVLLSLLLLH